MLDIQQDEYLPSIWARQVSRARGRGKVRRRGAASEETFAWSRLSWPTR